LKILDKTTIRLMFAVGLLMVTSGAFLGWMSVSTNQRLGDELVENNRARSQARVRDNLQTHVETVISHFAWLQKKVEANEMTRAEAEQRAKETIDSLTYDDGAGYYWVHSFDPESPKTVEMLFHPLKPALNGTDISSVSYSSGEKSGQTIMATRSSHKGTLVSTSDAAPMFVEMNRVIASNGQRGLVGYDWPKPGSSGYEPKLSYVELFKPWGWVVGTGVYVDDIEAEAAAETERVAAVVSSSTTRLALLVAVVMLIGIVGAVFVGRWISRRIGRVSERLRDIAEGEGDLTIRLEADRSDALGELSHWFNVFVDDLAEQLRDVNKAADDLREAAESLQQNSASMTTNAHTIRENTGAIAAASEEMNNGINTVAAAAEQASTNMNAIASAAEQSSTNMNVIASNADDVSHNINSLSASIEEMSASLNEVSRNCVQTAGAARSSNDRANSAMTNIAALETTSNKIGRIVEIIDDIADQTNLLALNATIEAASAGEAGKGFNVVANEVKDLAKQTAASTEDIAQKVAGMQRDMADSVTKMREVVEFSDNVQNLADMIAAAVEEQTATTNEIARNVSASAHGVNDMTRSVQELTTGVNEIARHTSEAAAGIHEVARSSSSVAAGSAEITSSLQQASMSVEELTNGVDTIHLAAENLTSSADHLSRLASRYRL
jgi:methyl-accepting chemotaxis protein